MNGAMGRTRWAIPEGFIPSHSHGLVSHETACLLNTAHVPAHVEITIYFSDRDPAGPYRLIVGPQRTLHLSFNDLVEPEPIPRDTDYASLIQSDVPIVVQHTRLDSRQAQLAVTSSVAYPVD